MNFKPCNRYILIQTEEEQQSKSAVLLPEDYKPKQDGFVTARVLATSEEASEFADKTIVVNKAMTEKVKVSGETLTLILQNYVMGVVEP